MPVKKNKSKKKSKTKNNIVSGDVQSEIFPIGNIRLGYFQSGNKLVVERSHPEYVWSEVYLVGEIFCRGSASQRNCRINAH